MVFFCFFRVTGKVSDDKVWCVNLLPVSALTPSHSFSADSVTSGNAQVASISVPHHLSLSIPSGSPAPLGLHPEDIDILLLLGLGTASSRNSAGADKSAEHLHLAWRPYAASRANDRQEENKKQVSAVQGLTVNIGDARSHQRKLFPFCSRQARRRQVSMLRHS